MNNVWPIAQIWLTGWGALALLMFFTWLIYLKTQLPSVVDVSWSLAIMLAGLFFLSQNPWSNKSILIASILVIWAFRLAGYLYLTRIRKNEVDKRYEDIISSWHKKNIGYFFNYQLQAILALGIATPFYFIASTPTNFLTLDYIGIGIIVLALPLETLADRQLYRYKQNPHGPVCDIGLWRYSRHPNYFFEWCIWVGFSLMALSNPYGYIGLLSPALLFFIMVVLTGPITERNSLKSRGQAFKAYQKRTSMFFPWPPKAKV